MTQLLVFRFFAGMFGAAPLINTGGVIADMFSPAQRGTAMGCFSAAPFLGPGKQSSFPFWNTSERPLKYKRLTIFSSWTHYWRIRHNHYRLEMGAG